jgi:hypothetical protein
MRLRPTRHEHSEPEPSPRPDGDDLQRRLARLAALMAMELNSGVMESEGRLNPL